jgi:hypothetical protein
MKRRRVSSLISLYAVLILLTACSSITPSPVVLPNTLPAPKVETTKIATDSSTIEVNPAAANTPTGSITGDQQVMHPEFGVEISGFDVDFVKIKELGAKWLRYNAILWSDLEPNEGEILWDKLSSLEPGMQKASEAGLKLIVIIRSTPGWAQNIQGHSCGQIREDKFGAFGDFLSQLTARLSPTPYNIHSWELWNEPDVDPGIIPGDSVFGCWGNQYDSLYGGEYFGRMLGAVVPKMHAADSSSKILNGGLLLDCDPADPGTPGRCRSNYDLPPHFFEGILKAGGIKELDFVSYHGYTTYDPNVYTPIVSEINMPSWQARGGVIIGKANFLREMMANFNTGLPLFLTETALLCPESFPQCNPAGPEFLQKQAEYGSWLVVRNYAENINTIWYPFEGPGWRNSGILDENQNPRPVYKSIQTALSKIDGSSVIRKIDQYPGISGYEFQSATGRFYFLAPISDQPPSWTAPENAAIVQDVFGQPVPADSLSPLTAPVFVYLQ